MLADYHIHTSFSDDSTCPMETVVMEAVQLRFDEICITDHVDYFLTVPSHLIDYEAYFREYNRLKEQYKDVISLKIGAEFGVQKETIPCFHRDVKQYPFDFIILSNHQIQDREFWNGDYQKGKTRIDFNRQYYEAILDVLEEFDCYSVLGHLDMIKRYDDQGSMDDSEHEVIIKKILAKVIQQQKGIEINTSSFRYQLASTTPSVTILKWYYEMGGTVLTIGSDSHQAKDLGANFIDVKKILKEIGFQKYCTFEQMRPIWHPL